MSLIRFEDWLLACDLLEYQIARLVAGNKHFKTLSMFFYKKFVEDDFAGKKANRFFDLYIRSKLFFGMEQEFGVFSFLIPKGKLSNRNYKLLTGPMRLVHYAHGIYLLRLTQDFVDEVVLVRKRISSFYGGDLRLQENKLLLKPDRVYFWRPYRKFRKKLKQSTSQKEAVRKLVLSFDIESFFDRLDLQVLVRELERVLPVSKKADMEFNSITAQQLVQFYNYLMTGKGIPQSDNDVIADFIGHVYLQLADLSLEDLLMNELGKTSFEVIRFADDFYIVFDIPAMADFQLASRQIRLIAEKISDLFAERWKLTINDKTELYDLGNESELQAFTDRLKRVSNPANYLKIDTEEDGTLDERAALLLDELERVRDLAQTSGFGQSAFVPEYLSDVFAEPVQAILKKRENIERLNEICSGSDFAFVKFCPREITLLLHLCAETWERYTSYLNQLNNPTIKESHLILSALTFSSFEDEDLKSKLLSTKNFSRVLHAMNNFEFSSAQVSYLNLTPSLIEKIASHEPILSQVRRRAFATRESNYNLAINHLCTEIIELARFCGFRSEEKRQILNAKDIAEWMAKLDCPNHETINIKNLFDRRNSNGISHSVNEGAIFEEVSLQEYSGFVRSAGVLFKKALSILDK